MLRIPRFAPPETLRVLAAFPHPQTRNASHSSFWAARDASRLGRIFAPSNSECFAFLVSGGPGRFASWPPCANPQKTSGEQALRPAFADLRRVLAIIRLYHFPDIVYNRNRAPLFGASPTRTPPHPEGTQCFLVALRGPPHPERLRTPKEHNASWSPFGARPTPDASAPRRNTMLPGRPSGPAPPGAPPHPEEHNLLVALRGPPTGPPPPPPPPGRLRPPKEHNASWSPFGARPTPDASAPRRTGQLHS